MSTAPSSDDYVLELVLRDGRRVRRLGHGDDETAAYEAYEQCMTRYPYFGVRLRKGGQILDYRLARPNRDHLPARILTWLAERSSGFEAVQRS